MQIDSHFRLYTLTLFSSKTSCRWSRGCSIKLNNNSPIFDNNGLGNEKKVISLRSTNDSELLSFAQQQSQVTQKTGID